MRYLVVLGALVASFGLAPSAQADDAPSTCLTAPVRGQKLQQAGKLIAAREHFRVCARAECNPDIIEHCKQWADDVEKALPSIIVVARDADGHDVSDVSVRIDDGVATPLSPHSIELDPGEHRVIVTHGGAKPAEEKILLQDAQKNRSVVVTFPGPPGRPRDDARTSRPIPTSAWIASGVAVVALGAFGFFGAKGVSDRSNKHCDTGCPTPVKQDVNTLFVAADVSLAAAAIAAGVAAWLYLSRPTVRIGRQDYGLVQSAIPLSQPWIWGSSTR
jgi:hypothetical protein